jgi:predicted transcriptional regulator of viral defense system
MSGRRLTLTPDGVELAYRHRTKGVIRLDPAVKSQGKMNKRWGLWINVVIDGAVVDS